MLRDTFRTLTARDFIDAAIYLLACMAITAVVVLA